MVIVKAVRCFNEGCNSVGIFCTTDEDGTFSSLYEWLAELSVKLYSCMLAEWGSCLQNYYIFEMNADFNLIQITNFCYVVAWSVNSFYSLVTISVSRLHIVNGKGMNINVESINWMVIDSVKLKYLGKTYSRTTLFDRNFMWTAGIRPRPVQ